jgi:hypothetical protein
MTEMWSQCHWILVEPRDDSTARAQDHYVAVSSSGGRYANDLYCCVNGTTATNYAS